MLNRKLNLKQSPNTSSSHSKQPLHSPTNIQYEGTHVKQIKSPLSLNYIQSPSTSAPLPQSQQSLSEVSPRKAPKSKTKRKPLSPKASGHDDTAKPPASPTRPGSGLSQPLRVKRRRSLHQQVMKKQILAAHQVPQSPKGQSSNANLKMLPDKGVRDPTSQPPSSPTSPVKSPTGSDLEYSTSANPSSYDVLNLPPIQEMSKFRLLEVPVRRIFFQKRSSDRYFPTMWMVVSAIVVVCVLASSIVAWKVTKAAGNIGVDDATLYAHTISLSLYNSTLKNVFMVAERIVHHNKAAFSKGLVDYNVTTNGTAAQTLLDSYFIQLVAYRSQISSVHYTTTDGSLFGAFYVEHLGYWESYNGLLYTWYVNADGVRTVLDYMETDDSSKGRWFLQIDPGQPEQALWTEVFSYIHTLWITFSTGAYNAAGEFVGVVGIDFQIDFARAILDMAPKELAAVVLLCDNKGRILSQSNTKSNNIEPYRNFFAAIYTSAEWEESINRTTPQAVSVEGNSFLFLIMPIERPGLQWFLVQFLDESQFHESLEDSELRVFLIVYGSVLIAIILGLLISFFATRPLGRMVKDMLHLSELDVSAASTGEIVQRRAGNTVKSVPVIMRTPQTTAVVKESSSHRLRKTRTHYLTPIKEIRAMQRSLLALTESIHSFSQFLPSVVIERIVSNTPGAASINVKPIYAAVMCLDLDNVSNLVYDHETDCSVIVCILEEFFNEMSDLICNMGGKILHYTSGGLTAIWIMDMAQPTQYASKAVTAAAWITMRAPRLCARWEPHATTSLASAGPTLNIHLGLHASELLIGNIGGSHLTTFTIIGEAEECAQVLLHNTTKYGCTALVSHELMRTLPRPMEYVTRPVEGLRFQGPSMYESDMAGMQVQESYYAIPFSGRNSHCSNGSAGDNSARTRLFGPNPAQQHAGGIPWGPKPMRARVETALPQWGRESGVGGDSAEYPLNMRPEFELTNPEHLSRMASAAVGSSLSSAYSLNAQGHLLMNSLVQTAENLRKLGVHYPLTNSLNPNWDLSILASFAENPMKSTEFQPPEFSPSVSGVVLAHQLFGIKGRVQHDVTEISQKYTELFLVVNKLLKTAFYTEVSSSSLDITGELRDVLGKIDFFIQQNPTDVMARKVLERRVKILALSFSPPHTTPNLKSNTISPFSPPPTKHMDSIQSVSSISEDLEQSRTFENQCKKMNIEAKARNGKTPSDGESIHESAEAPARTAHSPNALTESGLVLTPKEYRIVHEQLYGRMGGLSSSPPLCSASEPYITPECSFNTSLPLLQSPDSSASSHSSSGGNARIDRDSQLLDVASRPAEEKGSGVFTSTQPLPGPVIVGPSEIELSEFGAEGAKVRGRRNLGPSGDGSVSPTTASSRLSESFPLTPTAESGVEPTTLQGELAHTHMEVANLRRSSERSRAPPTTAATVDQDTTTNSYLAV